MEVTALSPQSSALLPDWPAPARVRALVTTRLLPGNSTPPYDAFNLGLRSGEPVPVVNANRELLMRAFALPSPPHWLRQVHGSNVVEFADSKTSPSPLTEEELHGRSALRALPSPALRAPSPARGEGKSNEIEADAAFTTQPGTVLAILTADCLPILLCADDGSEIAAVHAGWRGLSAGVIDACVTRLRTTPDKLLAWLGPAIDAASYEVGDEVRAAFLEKSEAAQSAFVPTRAGHWLCDLYTLARQRLGALGVRRIYGGEFDTITDARFYSYRRDGAGSGRFASLIWIT